jgi:HlyD family secretion protein
MARERLRGEGRSSPGAGSASLLTDAELLRRFAADRAEEAFAALVKRHGPLVLSVCRRGLGAEQDAEDAFQATFLVLARKAGSIADPGLLGNWLYGVATRIARKARVAQRKRQQREKPVWCLPSLPAPDAPARDDLGSVLREELNRLPEKYRVPVGLCYLEGKTNAEAARLLRWPTGTVKGRLARARDLLRSRLVCRGLGEAGEA